MKYFSSKSKMYQLREQNFVYFNLKILFFFLQQKFYIGKKTRKATINLDELSLGSLMKYAEDQKL